MKYCSSLRTATITLILMAWTSSALIASPASELAEALARYAEKEAAGKGAQTVSKEVKRSRDCGRRRASAQRQRRARFARGHKTGGEVRSRRDTCGREHAGRGTGFEGIGNAAGGTVAQSDRAPGGRSARKRACGDNRSLRAPRPCGPRLPILALAAGWLRARRRRLCTEQHMHNRRGDCLGPAHGWSRKRACFAAARPFAIDRQRQGPLLRMARPLCRSEPREVDRLSDISSRFSSQLRTHFRRR